MAPSSTSVCRPDRRCTPLVLVALLALLSPVCGLALPSAPPALSPHVPVRDETSLSYANGAHDGPGWTDPSTYGGSMLILVENGMREPINAIVSGRSDPYILSDAGFRDYVRSIGFSFECFDMHLGTPMRADLGDGNGMVEELFEYREVNAWDAGRAIGSCRESVSGGNHFRAWKQYGPLSQTGAWFLAVSAEKNLAYQHRIIKDGYNHGRDLLANASVVGGKYRGWEWRADVEYTTGLLTPGVHGINHFIPQDGRTAIITVTRVQTGDPPFRQRAAATIAQIGQYMAQFILAVLTQIQMHTYLL